MLVSSQASRKVKKKPVQAKVLVIYFLTFRIISTANIPVNT